VEGRTFRSFRIHFTSVSSQASETLQMPIAAVKESTGPVGNKSARLKVICPSHACTFQNIIAKTILEIHPAMRMMIGTAGTARTLEICEICVHPV